MTALTDEEKRLVEKLVEHPYRGYTTEQGNILLEMIKRLDAAFCEVETWVINTREKEHNRVPDDRIADGSVEVLDYVIEVFGAVRRKHR